MCSLFEGSDHDLLRRARLAATRRTAEADAPRADELLQSLRADELLEGVDLLRRADQLEDDCIGAEIGNACAEHLGERHQLRPLARRRRDLQERELALDGLARGELLHAQDVDELVHLLLDEDGKGVLHADALGNDRNQVETWLLALMPTPSLPPGTP